MTRNEKIQNIENFLNIYFDNYFSEVKDSERKEYIDLLEFLKTPEPQPLVNLDLHVGDKVITSKNEFGKVISVNGIDKCPVIVLIHRDDTNRDDAANFSQTGLLCGMRNLNYTIKKI